MKLDTERLYAAHTNPEKNSTAKRYPIKTHCGEFINNNEAIHNKGTNEIKNPDIFITLTVPYLSIFSYK